jgi:hypothetical protein
MFKDGRVPHHATCEPLVNNPWSSYSKEVCRDLKQQEFTCIPQSSLIKDSITPKPIS